MSKGTPDTSNVTHAVTSGNAVETVSAADEETTAEHKFTAKQVEEDCPVRLQQIGKEIAERLKIAEKQTTLAADHVIAVDRLLAEAKGLCDSGGFNKFRQHFCPQLGKSQAYALLAIGTGKKTLVEHRAKERERKQKTRANQKAAVANSGTVPENSDTEPEALAAPGDAEPETNIAPEQQTPWLSKARGSVNPGDKALMGFSSVVCRLVQITRNKKAERFAKTSITADELETLGKFLITAANLKKSVAVKLAAITSAPDNDTGSVGQPAVGTDDALLETSADPVA